MKQMQLENENVNWSQKGLQPTALHNVNMSIRMKYKRRYIMRIKFCFAFFSFTFTILTLGRE